MRKYRVPPSEGGGDNEGGSFDCPIEGSQQYRKYFLEHKESIIKVIAYLHICYSETEIPLLMVNCCGGRNSEVTRSYLCSRGHLTRPKEAQIIIQIKLNGPRRPIRPYRAAADDHNISRNGKLATLYYIRGRTKNNVIITIECG